MEPNDTNSAFELINKINLLLKTSNYDFLYLLQLVDIDPLNDLAGSDLSGAKLTGVNLQAANLRNCEFVNADLRSANLSNTNLEGANFLSANLENADLRGSNLVNVNFQNAVLINCDFSDAKIFGVNLTGSIFKKTEASADENANMYLLQKMASLLDELMGNRDRVAELYDLTRDRIEKLRSQESKDDFLKQATVAIGIADILKDDWQVFGSAVTVPPITSEPIMNVQITIPDAYVNDVMSDLNKRQGRVQKTESEHGSTVIVALVPLAQMERYSAYIRMLTSGKGFFSMELDHREAASQHLEAGIANVHEKRPILRKDSSDV